MAWEKNGMSLGTRNIPGNQTSDTPLRVRGQRLGSSAGSGSAGISPTPNPPGTGFVEGSGQQPWCEGGRGLVSADGKPADVLRPPVLWTWVCSVWGHLCHSRGARRGFTRWKLLAPTDKCPHAVWVWTQGAQCSQSRPSDQPIL